MRIIASSCESETSNHFSTRVYVASVHLLFQILKFHFSFITRTTLRNIVPHWIASFIHQNAQVSDFNVDLSVLSIARYLTMRSFSLQVPQKSHSLPPTILIFLLSPKHPTSTSTCLHACAPAPFVASCLLAFCSPDRPVSHSPS